MRLETLLLANAAEQRDGLLYLLGGWIDTLHIPPGQMPVLRSTLVLRFMVDRTECGKTHSVEVVLAAEDGEPAFSLQGAFTPNWPDGYPVGWKVPLVLMLNLQAVLPRLGLYGLNVLANGDWKGSLHLRAIELAAPTPEPPPPGT